MVRVVYGDEEKKYEDRSFFMYCGHSICPTTCIYAHQDRNCNCYFTHDTPNGVLKATERFNNDSA